MPRTKKPHHHLVTYFPPDPSIPLEKLRAAYARLSDDDPESVSQAHQLDASRAYAKRHGYVVTAIYQDWRTGLDPNRLAFKQLVEDAHAGKHGGVIFYDHYRFHRGVTGAYPVVRLHQELPAYQFAATVGGYDVEQIGIWAGISGTEVDTTRRRSTEQRRRRAAEGQWVSGNKPYWLERDPETRKPVLVAERAEAMLQAIELYLAGTPMQRVAAHMTHTAPPASKRTRWSSGRLRTAFRNPALWGRLDYARSLVITECRDGETVVVGRGTRADAVPFEVPALIHRTELERAECQVAGGCERDRFPAADTLDQAIKASNARAGGRPFTLEHPLRRRVVCPCGWRMGFRQKRYKGQDKDYGYLICSREHQRGKSVVADYPDCPVSGISTLRLWPQVRALVIEAVRQPDRLIEDVQRQIVAEATAETRGAAEEAAYLEQVSGTLAALTAAENRLYERWDAGEISNAVFQVQAARIASQRRLAEEAKRQVLAQRVVIQKAERAAASLRDGLVRASKLRLDGLGLEAWARLLAALVSDVVLDADGTPSLRWQRSV